jgi:prolyl-tRNA editing enzyme YbaK/EbsC (Cys-tRNA(Pro) deacylase)
MWSQTLADKPVQEAIDAKVREYAPPLEANTLTGHRVNAYSSAFALQIPGKGA